MKQDQPQVRMSPDQTFLETVSAVLLGVGLVMLVLGLSCKVFSWSYCSWQLVPVFGGDMRFPDDIASINLPLALLVIGLGIRLYSPYGWWIITILLMVLLTFFGFLVAFHFGNWPYTELNDGSWVRVALSLNPHGDALITSLLFELILICGFLFWWSPQVRSFYFQRHQYLAQSFHSDQSQ